MDGDQIVKNKYATLNCAQLHFHFLIRIGDDEMKVEKLIQDKRDDILRISRQHGARSVRLFGSFARSAPTEASDLDILVEMEPTRSLLDLIAIKQDLEDLLGFKVDVVTESSLSPYIRKDILKEAVNL